jgi:hypothetical protein
MADSNGVEQAVSRTLRDNLGRIQRTAEELNQAVNDLVSACASSRPANSLPPMVRAQTSAASLSAALEVLSRFVTTALQPASRSPFEQEITRATSLVTEELSTIAVQPEAVRVHPMEDSPDTASGVDSAPVDIPSPTNISQLEPPPFEPGLPAEHLSPDMKLEIVEELPPVAEVPPAVEPEFLSEPEPVFAPEPIAQAPTPEPGPEPDLALPVEQVMAPEAGPEITPRDGQPVFDVATLPDEERELHRRAYRVAKVSMQDIKMLHPEDIRLGRENKDLCFRLREDIERAHKEYGRRFESIAAHPVDYFYDWMVEILAGGNPEALGEYPYPSPVLRR